MKYYSTRDKSISISFEEAVMGGMDSSGGLFMPEKLPRLDPSVLDSLGKLDFPDVALRIVSPFVAGEIPEKELSILVKDAFDFPILMPRLDARTSVLELFHGPSCAFKDFGARFMARVMAYFAQRDGKRLHIIVATSGDTGSAVGSAFQDLPGFSVTILYPKGKISPLQEKQLSTFSGNVRSLAVAGTFDDCQKLVKTAFTDGELRRTMALSSANSINIARLVPQASYYAWAASRIAANGKASSKAGKDRPMCAFFVPSGNFGNLTAGLFAAEAGCPIDLFVAATNSNRPVPEYLATGVYRPRASVSTISNAMDVGAPSNFERMQDLFSLSQMRAKIIGISVSDSETRGALRDCKEKTGYLLEPHGAVGWKAWRELGAGIGAQAAKDGMGEPQAILLETAHPAKFAEVVKEELGIEPPMPDRLTAVLSKPDNSIPMEADYGAFKKYLLSGGR
jgi:threonine synthase